LRSPRGPLWPENIKRTKEPPAEVRQLLAQALTTTIVPKQLQDEDLGIEPIEDNYNLYLMRQTDTITPSKEEIANIELEILRKVQAAHFATEIRTCKNAEGLTVYRREGPLRKQGLWLDEDRILRVYHRSVGADCLPSDSVVPIALPRDHPLTKLIIRDAHRQVEHQGSRSTHAQVFSRFFIPKGYAAVKKICSECLYCRTRAPRALRPPTAPLHPSRLNAHTKPWLEVGMDHFGPFELNKRTKKWGLIFICLTTRAVHIEDVDGPGAEPFCHALDRFIQRRTTPQTLRSDRGTAFVNLAAQQNKTAEVYAEEIRLLALKKWRINLVFNPPGAPHWGGSWERTIKEIKKIVYAAFNNSGCKTWTADGLRTYLVRAEGILNRRPIAYGDDGEIITPAKFLNPAADVAVGPPRGDPKITSLAAVRNAEKDMWNKWVKFYLPSISAKQVLGEIHDAALKPGDRVLLREGSNPLVDSWTHAVIKEVFPSPDGRVRSVLVTVNGNDLIRDITRISILDGPVLRRREELTASPRGVSTNLEPSNMSAGDGDVLQLEDEEDSKTTSTSGNPAASPSGNTAELPNRPLTRGYKRASTEAPPFTPGLESIEL
jgi:hypothetical protein